MKHVVGLFIALLSINIVLGCARRIEPSNVMNDGRQTRLQSQAVPVTRVFDGRSGITFREFTQEVATPLVKKASFRGAVVADVKSGSAADEAGIRAQDIILQVNKTTITSIKDYEREMAKASPGKDIVLLIRRGTASTFVPLRFEKNSSKQIAPAAVPATALREKEDPAKKNTKTDGAINISRLSVFNFNTTNMDAVQYGPEVTNLLTDALGKNQAISIISRHDLQEFLRLNDLQQNDNLGNMVNIGSRLGLNFIVTGRIEKKGVILAIEFIVVDIHANKVIFTRKVQASGDSNLAMEVRKMSDSIAAAIAVSTR
jgi:membrane-associated protease RseP (regulator of RpoE activity)